jgi:hypothetical protein
MALKAINQNHLNLVQVVHHFILSFINHQLEADLMEELLIEPLLYFIGLILPILALLIITLANILVGQGKELLEVLQLIFHR